MTALVAQSISDIAWPCQKMSMDGFFTSYFLLFDRSISGARNTHFPDALTTYLSAV